MTTMNQTPSSNSTIPVVFAVGVLTATTLWWNFARETKKSLHVSYNKPKFPLPIRIMAALPNSMRRPMVLQGASPKPPMDAIDLGIANKSPFLEKKELVPGKLWRVRYQFVKNLDMLSITKAIFGMDLLDEEAILSEVSSQAEKEQLKQIMSKLAALIEACKDLTDPREKALKCFEAGFVESQDMLVAKVKDNGLLLYNPSRMHEEIVEYLQSLGSVEYVVSGSASHTNQLPQAAKTFPSAKMVCSNAANLKCQSVGMRPADYEYTDPTALEEIQALLGPEVKLFHVQGDTFTQCLAVVAHGHLLDTDLVCYGNGKRHNNVPDSVWGDKTDLSLEVGFARLLYYASAAKGTVARGYLPDFRVLGCDPTSIFHKLALDCPNPDGSSCVEMAASLRKLVGFDFVDNVHSIYDESASAQEFKDVVNGSWSWLDGKSLFE